jgi:hypothetical protein
MASRLVIPDRDLRVLEFAAEMYGVPMSLAAELIAADPASVDTDGGRRKALNVKNSETVARRTAARLEAGHLARRVTVRREPWLVPTGPGLALATAEGQEEPYELWHPVAWKLEHVAATARLRLHLAKQRPEATWISERAIRRRWKNDSPEARVRKCDGGLRWPDGTATGVEVELHVKGEHLYQGIVADRDQEWDTGIWWYCPAGDMQRLSRYLEAAGGFDHKVHELPEGVTL